VPVVLLVEAFAGAPMLRMPRLATWRTLTPIGLAACVTVPLGGYVLVHADQDALRRAIAAVVAIFALLLLRGARYTGAHGVPSSLAVGAVSGTLLGATGIGGPPVILYLLSGPDSVQVTRANLTLYVALISVAGLAMLATRGILGATALTSTFLRPAHLDRRLGRARLFARFSDRRFRQFTLVLFLAVSTLHTARVKSRGADLLIRTLGNAGVRRFHGFGQPAIMPVLTPHWMASSSSMRGTRRRLCMATRHRILRSWGGARDRRPGSRERRIRAVHGADDRGADAAPFGTCSASRDWNGRIPGNAPGRRRDAGIQSGMDVHRRGRHRWRCRARRPHRAVGSTGPGPR
jgi:uncharacterized membrane protein YfcA